MSASHPTARKGAGYRLVAVLGVLGAFVVAAVLITAVLSSKPSPFSLTVSPPGRSVIRGRVATYVITIKRTKGFDAKLRLDVLGLPRKAGYRLTRSGRDRATLAIGTTELTPLVAPRATAVLPCTQAEQLVPRPVNQDGCRGAKLTLTYSGSAVGR